MADNNKILNSIKALYTNIQCSPVRVDDDLTLSFPMTNSIKQGCPLSTFLSINDLIDYLGWDPSEGLYFISLGNCKLNAVLYADDLALIVENSNA